MCEWQRLRTRLNHDWLKNEYLKNLDGLIVQLRASQTMDSNLCGELRAYLMGWSRNHGEIETLLNSAENRLSPRILFEEDPLIRCSSEHRTWLAPLIHGLWLVRYGIRERIEETRGILSEAERSHVRLQSEFSGTQDMVQILEALETFADWVGNLSRLISKFPDKVVTV